MTDNTLDKEEEFNRQIWEIIERNLPVGFLHQPKRWHYAEQMRTEFKSLIADREKKMLEFVIGKDYFVDERRGSKVEPSTKSTYRAINKEKLNQRQRAKEWEGRNG